MWVLSNTLKGRTKNKIVLQDLNSLKTGKNPVDRKKNRRNWNPYFYHKFETEVRIKWKDYLRFDNYR